MLKQPIHHRLEAVHKSPSAAKKELGIWCDLTPRLIPKGFHRLVYSLRLSVGELNTFGRTQTLLLAFTFRFSLDF